jgi:hypothetical protein
MRKSEHISVSRNAGEADAVRANLVRVSLALMAFVLAMGVQAYGAPAAHACGGFFCSRAAPVVQSAEEIIFVDNPDDTVTAVIRINYTGPSQKFAWVLPIEGAPSQIQVSSNLAFNSLRTATNPSYTLTRTVEGSCKVEPQPMFAAGAPSAGGTATNSGSAGKAAPAVTVIDQGSVGPYDFEVISVDPSLSDPADVAIKWLGDHGYDLSDLGPSVLRPYLADGLNLMAFKLTKGPNATSGSIRPVMVTFNSKLPGIPIRPTAVASQPDMGILVWLLSDHQGVPKNYKSLVLNEALINWFNFNSNYRAVVTAAADEAGGQGFVTEMAGDSKQLKDIVYSPGQAQQWTQFSQQTFADGFAAIQSAGQYASWDGFQDAVCKGATLPSTLTCAMFASNPLSYRSMVQVDTTKFLTALYEGVVKPVIATQDLLLSRPYFTRVFTTMSPEEMTLDPIFDFNADLADISNKHVAMQVVQCSSNVTLSQAPWRILLPQGGVVSGSGSGGVWPLSLGGSVPANLKVVELGTSGGGKVVQDNTSMILKVLADAGGSAGSAQTSAAQRVPIGGAQGGNGGGVPIGGNAGVTAGGGGGSGGSGDKGSSGCAIAHASGASSLGSAWLLALALGLVRRRGQQALAASR